MAANFALSSHSKKWIVSRAEYETWRQINNDFLSLDEVFTLHSFLVDCL